MSITDGKPAAGGESLFLPKDEATHGSNTRGDNQSTDSFEAPRSPAECMAAVLKELVGLNYITVADNRRFNPRRPIKISFLPNRYESFDSKRSAIDSVRSSLITYNELVTDDEKLVSSGIIGNAFGIVPFGSALYLNSTSENVINTILSSGIAHIRQQTR